MFAKLQRLAGQSVVYTIGGALAPSLSFLLLPLYTRVLSVDDYGILGVVGPLYSLLSILLTLGLESALMRFYFDFEGQPERRRGYVATVTLLLLGNGLLVSLLLTVAGPSLFGAILPNTPFHPFILLTIWNACISLTQVAPRVLFRAEEKPVRFVALTLTDFLITTTLIILFVAGFRQGAVGNLRGQVLAAGIMAVPSLWLAARRCNLRISWSHVRTSLAFSLPLLPHVIGNWVLNVSDRLVLDNLVPKGEVGLYSLGYQFGIVMTLLSMGLNGAWVPFFYKHAGRRENDAMVGTFITYQVLAMAAVALVLALLAREAIQIMAHASFWSAYRVVPLVVLGYFCRFLYLFPVNGLLFVKRTYWVAIWTSVAAALNVGLNLWMVPRYGIQAAAFNTFVGFAVLLVGVYVTGQRQYRIHYEYGRIGRIMAVAGVVFAAGWWLAPEGLWARICIKVALLASSPLLLWATGFLSAAERRRLGQMWRRLTAGRGRGRE